jgi:hypothetical protein
MTLSDQELSEALQQAIVPLSGTIFYYIRKRWLD